MSEGGVVERQKNILQVEALATEAITTAIRGLLPVKQILKDYLGDDADEVVDDVPEKPEVKEEVVPAAPEVKEEVKEVKEEVKEVKEVKEEVKEVNEEVKEVDEKEDKPAVATASPSVIKIDTEPAVHFSDYDAVFDETKGAPEMLFNPKDGDEEDDVSSDALTIHDGPDTPLTADDAEDLDAPVAAPAPVIKKDAIDDSDVVVLE